MKQTLHDLGRFAIKKARRTDEKQTAKNEINKVVGMAQETIFSATTVFPFTFFPDTISISRTKLTITRRSFFKLSDMVSINIEDILNIVPHTGPFFGSLEIHTKFFDPGKPYTVNYLWRQDTLKIDYIMHGYRIALEKKIDTDALSCKELANMLSKLGEKAA